jgi:hypothetical protein
MKAKVKASKRKKFAHLARKGHPDLRTKAGRAWKARQLERAARAAARDNAKMEALLNLKTEVAWASKERLDQAVRESMAGHGETKALGPFNPKDSIVVEPLSEAYEKLRDAAANLPRVPVKVDPDLRKEWVRKFDKLNPGLIQEALLLGDPVAEPEPRHPYQRFIKPEVGRISSAEPNLLPLPPSVPGAYSRVMV